MKKAILGRGRNKWAPIASYVLAGLIALEEIMKAGETSKTNILIAVGIAVLGRIVNTTNAK